MRAIPRFLAPSILKSSQRGKFAPEPTILFTLHVPFEVFGWVLVLTYSTLMRRALFQKNRFSLLKELSKKILFHLVPIYLTAAIIESTIIYIRMR